jgi:hypothetical protein
MRSPISTAFASRREPRLFSSAVPCGHDPDYEILRGDPQFQKLLAKLK